MHEKLLKQISEFFVGICLEDLNHLEIQIYKVLAENDYLKYNYFTDSIEKK